MFRPRLGDCVVMRTAMLLGGAIALAAGGVALRSHSEALPFYRTSDRTPEWIGPADSRYHAIHQVPDFALLDQDGVPVTRAALDGKITVVSFFFTTCKDLCPRLRTNLMAVQDAFAGDSSVVILSHTIAPEVDDTAVLRRYASVNHLQRGRWRLLTGPDSTVRRLMTAGYFVALPREVDGQATTALHSETVVLVDGQHRIRGMYDGSLPFDVGRLIEDVRRLR